MRISDWSSDVCSSDLSAAAIKSGGTTRRAAKMVVLDVDHPDIESFVEWKVVEEQKVAALVAGSKSASACLSEVMAACSMADGEARFDPQANPGLRQAIRSARRSNIPDHPGHPANHIHRTGHP